MNCLICGDEYKKGNMRVVARKGDAMLVHVNCKTCKNPTLGLITRSGSNSVVTMGLLTDLDYEEAVEMIDRGPITVDEVLDTYQTNWKI